MKYKSVIDWTAQESNTMIVETVFNATGNLHENTQFDFCGIQASFQVMPVERSNLQDCIRVLFNISIKDDQSMKVAAQEGGIQLILDVLKNLHKWKQLQA